MELSRNDLVLKLIVEEFIKTAEPVGSNTLIEKYQLPYSSATIRNDMMFLENEGLIEKTHTSSGRVPSAKGYRYYVTHLDLDQGVDLDQEFKREFQLVLKKKSRSIEEVVEMSCEILSEMTNLATVVLGPKSADEHLISIQIIPLSEQVATAVIVTDRGYVENKTFVIGTLSADALASCVKLMNERLNGTSISELVDKTLALKPLVSKMIGKNSEVLMEAFTEAFVKFAKQRLQTYGTTRLLELPDYDDENRDKVKNILKLLDSPSEFHEAVDDATAATPGHSTGVDVRFMNDEGEDMAVVTQDVKIAGKRETKIAVVGPKRMNYRKVLSNLEYVSKMLAEYFDGPEEEDDEKEE